MTSGKKVVFFFVLLLMLGWMFFMGILVGRKTSPVSFDTTDFQKWLAGIAEKSAPENSGSDETEVEFYDVLEKSLPEGDGSLETAEEIVPAETESESPEKMAFKTSKKKMTLDASASDIKAETPSQKDSEASSGRTEKSVLQAQKSIYTVQVAAYRDFKDALEQMKILEQKGFHPYKTIGRKNGIVWHRVRTGSFSSMNEARAYLGRLKKSGISDGIIIKRESQ